MATVTEIYPSAQLSSSTGGASRRITENTYAAIIRHLTDTDGCFIIKHDEENNILHIMLGGYYIVVDINNEYEKSALYAGINVNSVAQTDDSRYIIEELIPIGDPKESFDETDFVKFDTNSISGCKYTLQLLDNDGTVCQSSYRKFDASSSAMQEIKYTAIVCGTI